VSANQRHASGRKPRPYIGAALAASLTDKPGFYVGKPWIVRPLDSVHLDQVAAFVIAAKDDHPADARGAHFAEGDNPTRASVRRNPHG
jgi:siroheme synthase (precorrin-2 oxidase/ferrochelatase)